MISVETTDDKILESLAETKLSCTKKIYLHKSCKLHDCKNCPINMDYQEVYKRLSAAGKLRVNVLYERKFNIDRIINSERSILDNVVFVFSLIVICIICILFIIVIPFHIFVHLIRSI